MARGRFSDTFQITSNTDTAVVPAPGAGQRIYVYYIGVSVSVAGTSSRLRVENGAGGDVIFRAATTGADSFNHANFSTANSQYSGYALAENTALNVNTSGTAAATVDVQVIWEVR